jgi:probable phosphoglycerate mutase
MQLLYFLRHGQTEWNATGRWQGHIDVPLNDTGRAQAKRNGALLSELIDDPDEFEFIASPLIRARQTINIALEAMGMPQDRYRTDDRLKEIDLGTWSGKTREEVIRDDPENYQRRQADHWNVPAPQGESYAQVYARVAACLAELSRPALIVAHGGVSRCVRGHFGGLTPEQMMQLDVPQDKVLMIEAGNLIWL